MGLVYTECGIHFEGIDIILTEMHAQDIHALLARKEIRAELMLTSSEPAPVNQPLNQHGKDLCKRNGFNLFI